MEYISKFDELLKIKKNGQYELKNDISCGNARISCLLEYFTGKLYGNGHKISNLIITDEIWGDEQTLALFHDMSKAEIKDIRFDNIIMAYQRGCYQPRIGALAGSCSDCSIKNVVMDVTNNSNSKTPLIYESNNCELINNTIKCNGKNVPIVKYDEER